MFTLFCYDLQCLKQKPDGPADFRVGIGMCLSRLGQLDKARFVSCLLPASLPIASV